MSFLPDIMLSLAAALFAPTIMHGHPVSLTSRLLTQAPPLAVPATVTQRSTILLYWAITHQSPPVRSHLIRGHHLHPTAATHCLPNITTVTHACCGSAVSAHASAPFCTNVWLVIALSLAAIAVAANELYLLSEMYCGFY